MRWSSATEDCVAWRLPRQSAPHLKRWHLPTAALTDTTNPVPLGLLLPRLLRPAVAAALVAVLMLMLMLMVPLERLAQLTGPTYCESAVACTSRRR